MTSHVNEASPTATQEPTHTICWACGGHADQQCPCGMEDQHYLGFTILDLRNLHQRMTILENNAGDDYISYIAELVVSRCQSLMELLEELDQEAA